MSLNPLRSDDSKFYRIVMKHLYCIGAYFRSMRAASQLRYSEARNCWVKNMAFCVLFSDTSDEDSVYDSEGLTSDVPSCTLH